RSWRPDFRFDFFTVLSSKERGKTQHMTARHGSISDFFLKLSDLSLLLIALGVAIVYRYAPDENPIFVIDYLSERVMVINAILGFLLLLTWYAAFAAQGLYVSHRLNSFRREIVEI